MKKIWAMPEKWDKTVARAKYFTDPKELFTAIEVARQKDNAYWTQLHNQHPTTKVYLKRVRDKSKYLSYLSRKIVEILPLGEGTQCSKMLKSDLAELARHVGYL